MLSYFIEVLMVFLHLAAAAVIVLFARYGLDISTPDKDLDALMRLFKIDFAFVMPDDTFAPEKWSHVVVSEDVDTKVSD